MAPLLSRSPAQGPLAGASILVTRPARQAAATVRRIAALGGAPLVFSAIVILPPEHATELERVHSQLRACDFAIFVSANAVGYGAPGTRHWPTR